MVGEFVLHRSIRFHLLGLGPMLASAAAFAAAALAAAALSTALAAAFAAAALPAAAVTTGRSVSASQRRFWRSDHPCRSGELCL